MEARTTQKRGPLTVAEKKHRRENDLCLYCGDSEHKVAECLKCSKKRSTVTDASNPEAPNMHRQAFRPSGATVPTMNKPDEAVKERGLLALPREIRDKIYEELFYVDEFEIQRFHAMPRLDTSFLSVNRQLYHEASETFYEKNGWVTATVTDMIANSIAWDCIRSIPGISGSPGRRQSVRRYENDRLSKSAILNMDLQQDSESSAKKINLVIPLIAMPRVCRLITHCNWGEDTDLVLQFNCHARESHHSRLLGYLGQARGLRRVDISSPEPTWASLNTVLLMIHPYTRLAEILNTMLAYQESSEKELKHGRILTARIIVQDGVDFIDWWSDRMRRSMARAQAIEDNDLDLLCQTRAEMGFSSASLSLRLGNIESAQKAIEGVLSKLWRDQRLSQIHKARAHYHMAQTFEALGWGNAALYSYLQALRLRPGYSDADAAVDRMEANLGSGTALEDARIRHNLDHVLNRFRGKSTLSAVIRDRDYKMIFRNFEGTATEIRSIDRDSTGETDLVYMNPDYSGDGYDDDQDDD